MKRRVSAAPLLPLLAAFACGDEAWNPSPVGTLEAMDDPVDTVSLPLFMDDLVWDGDAFAPPPEDVPEALAASSDAAPKVLWLFYADGKGRYGTICGAAPAFKCTFGGAEGIPGCQKKVQTYLNGYYKDFNLIFTLTKPTSGAYQTEVITDAGSSWCGKPAGVLGVAPAGCSLAGSAVSYTFECNEARKCAVTIAQEHAHTVGLMHTNSKNDLLTPSWPCTCPGFEDKNNSTIQGICGATQNSYMLMKSRLGEWTGGEKPDPFGGSGGGSGGSGGGGMGGTGGMGGGGSGGSGGSGGGGSGGGGSGGGGSGGGGSGGTGGDGGGAEEPGESDVSGGCAVGQRAPASGSLLILVALGALLVRSRRDGGCAPSNRRHE